MSNVAKELRELARNNSQFGDKLIELAREAESKDIYRQLKTSGVNATIAFTKDSQYSVRIKINDMVFYQDDVDELIDRLRDIRNDLPRV